MLDYLQVIGCAEGNLVTTKNRKVEQSKIPELDVNEQVRAAIGKVFSKKQLEIATAANVGEALKFIEQKPFDVLRSPSYPTEQRDGFRAVSKMHKTNPNALTLVSMGFPELKRTLDVILDADGMLVKPEANPTFPEPTHDKLKVPETQQKPDFDRVAAILERDIPVTIIEWLDRVERDDDLTRVPLSRAERAGHIPRLIWELAHRLRVPRKRGMRTESEIAVEHGRLRYLQGYLISMIVEESRILQVCIFETLYNSLSSENFRDVLSDSNTITDECNLQLEQTLASFTIQAQRVRRG